MPANIYEDDAVEDASEALAPLVPRVDTHQHSASSPTHSSVLSKYTFASYRNDGRCMLRSGKYTGETNILRRTSASASSGTQGQGASKMPHGYGTFKTSTGYSFSGDWANGIPSGPGVEVLDGFPSVSDPMCGGEIVGTWDGEGHLESTESMRTLKQRFLDGNADQADAMAAAGYGTGVLQSA